MLTRKGRETTETTEITEITENKPKQAEDILDAPLPTELDQPYAGPDAAGDAGVVAGRKIKTVAAVAPKSFVGSVVKEGAKSAEKLLSSSESAPALDSSKQEKTLGLPKIKLTDAEKALARNKAGKRSKKAWLEADKAWLEADKAIEDARKAKDAAKKARNTKGLSKKAKKKTKKAAKNLRKRAAEKNKLAIEKTRYAQSLHNNALNQSLNKMSSQAKTAQREFEQKFGASSIGRPVDPPKSAVKSVGKGFSQDAVAKRVIGRVFDKYDPQNQYGHAESAVIGGLKTVAGTRAQINSSGAAKDMIQAKLAKAKLKALEGSSERHAPAARTTLRAQIVNGIHAKDALVKGRMTGAGVVGMAVAHSFAGHELGKRIHEQVNEAAPSNMSQVDKDRISGAITSGVLGGTGAIVGEMSKEAVEKVMEIARSGKAVNVTALKTAMEGMTMRTAATTAGKLALRGSATGVAVTFAFEGAKLVINHYDEEGVIKGKIDAITADAEDFVLDMAARMAVAAAQEINPEFAERIEAERKKQAADRAQEKAKQEAEAKQKDAEKARAQAEAEARAKAIEKARKESEERIRSAFERAKQLKQARKAKAEAEAKEKAAEEAAKPALKSDQEIRKEAENSISRPNIINRGVVFFGRTIQAGVRFVTSGGSMDDALRVYSECQEAEITEAGERIRIQDKQAKGYDLSESEQAKVDEWRRRRREAELAAELAAMSDPDSDSDDDDNPHTFFSSASNFVQSAAETEAEKLETGYRCEDEDDMNQIIQDNTLDFM